jgi:hypothetical protein
MTQKVALSIGPRFPGRVLGVGLSLAESLLLIVQPGKNPGRERAPELTVGDTKAAVVAHQLELPRRHATGCCVIRRLVQHEAPTAAMSPLVKQDGQCRVLAKVLVQVNHEPISPPFG